MRFALPVVLAFSLAGAAQAQEYDLRRSGLPREVAQHLRSVMADDRTTHYSGSSTIAADRVIEGPVVVTDGTLTIAGAIRGELIALRGDVVLETGAAVDGDVTIVDGVLRGEDRARLGGTVTVYGEGFDLLARAERFHDSPDWWNARRHWSDRRGDADLRVRVAENYNRVEGLPVQIGPDIRTGGSNPTRIEAMAIWRTDVGPLTETQRMGYIARIEQFFGGHQAFRLGAGVRSTVDPIETWSLTSLEASLSAALFNEDQRDYFAREGWSAYARITPPGAPLDVTLEYADEKHRSKAARDPWSLFNDDRTWRSQPLIGEGDVQVLRGSAEWDDRWGRDFRMRGLFARAEVTHALDGTFTVPGTVALPDATFGAADPLAFDASFTTALLDLRAYQRAGPGGVLGLRVVGGGALDARALPPQFQHAIGGAGSLPGYSLFSGDCGARGALVARADDAAAAPAAYFPSYGCDRFALVQVEYRGGIDLHFGHWNGRGDDGWDVDADFDWTVFFDAGRGWALENELYPGRSDTGTLYDVGAGVILGGLGVYGAVPLNGEDRSLRMFVRLGPRF